jgi:hypothetical protein
MVFGSFFLHVFPICFRFSIAVCNQQGFTNWSTDCASHSALNSIKKQYVHLFTYAVLQNLSGSCYDTTEKQAKHFKMNKSLHLSFNIINFLWPNDQSFGVASRYGSESTQMMRLSAAPVLQCCQVIRYIVNEYKRLRLWFVLKKCAIKAPFPVFKYSFVASYCILVQ